MIGGVVLKCTETIGVVSCFGCRPSMLISCGFGAVMSVSLAVTEIVGLLLCSCDNSPANFECINMGRPSNWVGDSTVSVRHMHDDECWLIRHPVSGFGGNVLARC